MSAEETAVPNAGDGDPSEQVPAVRGSQASISKIADDSVARESTAVGMFGPYRLDGLIGRGGMGEVWRAYDVTKDRVVALKRLPPRLAQNPEFQVRFKREARIAAQLREPHIIPIHDYGEIDGQLFLDMRLVDGVDLASALDQFGPLHPVRAVEITSQIGSALDAAHAVGLVHRDVKPSNVLLTGPGPEWDFVYLIDFGISHAADDTRITHTGLSVGTPAYLAPERYRGHGDHRADVYALGGLLYTMLTGANPFPGDGPTQMYAHLHSPPPAPSQHRAELPSGLDEVVAKAMAKDPDHRYQGAGALATTAREALTTSARPGNPSPATVRSRILGTSPYAPAAAARPRFRRRWLLGFVLVTFAIAGAGFEIDHRNTPAAVATTPVGRNPVGVAITPDGRHAYITNYTTPGTVSVIDTATGTVTATIPVGANPEGVAITPDGRHAYVSNHDSETVSVIDTARNTVTATIPATVSVIDAGRNITATIPAGQGLVVVAPDGHRTYVVDYTIPGTVSVIDTAANTVTATIAIGKTSYGVAITPDGRHAYISDSGSRSVSVIDTATNTITATILTGRYPYGVAITPDSRRAYVANYGSNTVSVIDTASNAVIATIPTGTSPYGVAITPDGRRAYVTNYDANIVSVIDTATNAVTATIPVGPNPEGLAIAPDGRRTYVANSGSNTVSVIDTSAG